MRAAISAIASYGTHSIPLAIPALAFVERHVEKLGFDLAIVILRQHDIRPALVGREIGRVDVGDRPAKFQAMLQKIAQHTEHAPVNTLIRRIVHQQTTDLIA